MKTGTPKQRYDATKQLLDFYTSYRRVIGDTLYADSARKYFPVLKSMTKDSVQKVNYELLQAWFLVRTNLLQSFEHLRNGIKGARESKNKALIGESYLTAGMLSESELDLTQGLNYYFLASSFFKLVKDEENEAICNVKLGNLLITYLQYDKALKYLSYSADVFYRHRNYHEYGLAIDHVIAIHLRKGEFDKAFKTLAILEERLDNKLYAEELIKVYVHIAIAYISIGDSKLCESYLTKGYGLAAGLNGSTITKALPYLGFAQFYLSTGNVTKALQYLTFCEALAEKVTVRDREYYFTLDELNRSYYSYYMAVGDVEKANASIFGALYQKVNTDQLLKLEAVVKVFEAEKDENYTIENLQSINEEQLKINERQATKLNYLIFLAGLLLFVLAAIYYRYRERQKIAKYLETEVESRTQELKAQSQEKTLMLKEIHHRVKNNLQLISSFLNLQKHYATSAKSTEMIISETQERVRCMAIIHEKLYSAESLSNLDTHAYLSEIANYVYQSYSNSSSNINVHLNIESSKLPLDRMIPCGLIINELMSNCFKYAFKNRESGDVWVDFTEDDQQLKKLIIRDNGIGLPDNFDVEKLNSLGMNIVIGLVDQLDGKLQMFKDNGTTFEIIF